mmetsp:Transcript_1495/g.1789  ORF Transcript_1495/g.1789 Transcript_1495/m.1789 type:complete len:146 (-) Transcript_1495:233-670(-)
MRLTYLMTRVRTCIPYVILLDSIHHLVLKIHSFEKIVIVQRISCLFSNFSSSSCKIARFDSFKVLKLHSLAKFPDFRGRISCLLLEFLLFVWVDSSKVSSCVGVRFNLSLVPPVIPCKLKKLALAAGGITEYTALRESSWKLGFL